MAANSVVTKDVAPYSIVAGTPDQWVKDRFDAKVIDELLALKVYDWPPEKFTALKSYLCALDLAALKQAVIQYDAEPHNPLS